MVNQINLTDWYSREEFVEELIDKCFNGEEIVNIFSVLYLFFDTYIVDMTIDRYDSLNPQSITIK